MEFSGVALDIRVTPFRAAVADLTWVDGGNVVDVRRRGLTTIETVEGTKSDTSGAAV